MLLAAEVKKVVLAADGDELIVQYEDGKLVKTKSFLSNAYNFIQQNMHLSWGEAQEELKDMFHYEFGNAPVHYTVLNGLARIYVEVHNSPSWNAWRLDDDMREDPLDEEELKQLHRDFWLV